MIIPVKFPGEITYAIPESLTAGSPVETGSWVSVMFGPKKYLGVISQTGIEADLPEKRIRDIIAIEQLPKAGRYEIELWRSVSEYYMCTVGEVFKCAYPPRKVAREGKRLSDKETAERRKARLAAEIEAKLAREFSRIEKKITLAANRKAPSSGKTGTIEGNKDCTENALRAELYGKSRILGKFVNAPLPLIDIKKYSPEDIGRLSLTLAETMTGKRVTAERFKQAESSGQAPQDRLPRLSEAQQKAMQAILANFAEGKRVLLKGVAGSGKTEIYVSLAAGFMAKGKSVLMLVPEISLSRQLEQRIKSFFPDKVIVYHSKESIARKDEAAARLRSGESLFVLGTRSALFLPYPDLGCIIVDEENDTSYKQTEPAPRYNGRDTAALLSAITGAPLLLGSATPSYESIYNVLTGKFSEVCLDERYHKGGTTRTIVIDTLAERKKRGMKGQISIKLAGMMQDTLNSGRQIMVFRSRKSYSPVLQCAECGEMPKCPECNAYLSYHKADGCLECHYCGSRFEYNGTCPKCGGRLEGRGAGTEKIEEDIGKMFPRANVARLDSDVTRNPNAEKQILKGFSCGQTDILIGTQIIAKGFDFDNVGLVAIINADSLIGVQNFRADENALQLLSQLKGRCARRGSDGLFVIQTEQPEHPVYKRFLMQEPPENGMRERQTFDYPPFTRMVEIVLRSNDEKSLDDKAGELHKALDEGIAAHVGIPVSPQVDKIAGKHIRVIRIRLRRDKSLSTAKRKIENIASKILGEGKTEYYFNPDPM